MADRVALLDTLAGPDGAAHTITHIGTHDELLATVPRYRYLLAADDELDDGCEPQPDWGSRRRACPPWTTPSEGPRGADGRAPARRVRVLRGRRPVTAGTGRSAGQTGGWRGDWTSRPAICRSTRRALRRRDALQLLGALLRPYRYAVAGPRGGRGRGKRCPPCHSAARQTGGSTTPSRRCCPAPPANSSWWWPSCAGLVALQAISRMASTRLGPDRTAHAAGTAPPAVPSYRPSGHRVSMTATPPVGWSAGRPTMSEAHPGNAWKAASTVWSPRC